MKDKNFSQLKQAESLKEFEKLNVLFMRRLFKSDIGNKKNR